MRSTVSIFAAAILLAFSLPVMAQEAPPTDARGFVDFSELDTWFSDSPTLEVNIDGVILRMVSRASKTSEPDLASALDRIESIRVRTYEQTDPALADRIAALSDDLVSKGWSRVVRIRDNNETVDVMLNTTDDDVLSGLSVFIYKPGNESIFVNIAGEITPDQLDKIGSAFNISQLAELSNYDFPES